MKLKWKHTQKMNNTYEHYLKLLHHMMTMKMLRGNSITIYCILLNTELSKTELKTHYN